MTTDGDLLLEDFHEAGIWLPGEGFDQCDASLWGRVQQCVVNAKAIQTLETNRYKKGLGGHYIETSHGFHQPVRQGPCEAPWNRHPPSRQCSCSWTTSWRGLTVALIHQMECRPAILAMLAVVVWLLVGTLV